MMKNMDVFSKRLLIAALSITMVFSGASLLVFTVSHAEAQNNGGNYQQSPGGESGRYGMATVIASSRTTGGSGRAGGGGETINRYNILVWDTQTGASRIYFYDDNSASYMATLKQLPQQPMN